MNVEKRFCSECGNEYTINDKFCSECGKALTEDRGPSKILRKETVTGLEKSVQTKKNNGVTGLVLIILGLMILMADILIRIGFITGNTSLSEFVVGIGYVAFGIVLTTKRIKKFGWGIVAVLFGGGAINNCYVAYILSDLPSLIIGIVCLLLTIAFTFFILKANVTKHS